MTRFAAAVLAPFLLAGCFYTTRSEPRVQKLQVVTDPPRAYLWQESDGQRKALGYSPAPLDVPYEVQVRQVNRGWWWGTIGAFGAAAVSGVVLAYADSDTTSTTYSLGQGLMYGGLGAALAAWYLFYTLDAAAAVEIPPEPFAIQLHASLPGYLEQVLDVPVPQDGNTVRLSLPPDPTAAPVAVRPEPALDSQPDNPIPAKGTADGGAPLVVVAVFDVQDASGELDRRTLDQLTDYLAASLTRHTGMRVVPRDQLRQRLAEQKGKSHDRCFEESCQIELGRALAAQKSLATKLLHVGNRCALTATLFDLKTETTEKSALHRTDCGLDPLLDGLDQLAQQLR